MQIFMISKLECTMMPILPVCLLMVIISVPLGVNTQEVVTDSDLFVSYTDPVALRVINITQFTAHLEWTIPPETISRLKAMRVNCTTLKSLIEPYDIFPPAITLYNPSITGKQITLRDLQPATQYSCSLVGALSLDVGREKLTVLSQPAVFSTLMEKEDKIYRSSSYQANVINITLGVVGGLIAVIVAIVLIVIGYWKYKKSRNLGGWKGRKSKKFRMHLSKKMSKPDDFPPPSPPYSPSPRHSSEKHSKKHRDPDKKPKKSKPAGEKTKPPRDKEKRNKSSDRSGEGKSSGTNKSRSKKPSKKKQQNSAKYTHAYTYSELQTRSSEEEIFGYKDTELKHELTTDLGWDPMTYYPSASRKPYMPEHITAKHTGMKDTSSPALVVKSRDDHDTASSSYAKGEYYQSHFAQPLY